MIKQTWYKQTSQMIWRSDDNDALVFYIPLDIR